MEDQEVVIDLALPETDPNHIRYQPIDQEERASFRRANREQADQAARAHLRLDRNKRLADTDWVELPSARMRLTPERLDAAMVYRQQLRDINVDALDELPDAPKWLT